MSRGGAVLSSRNFSSEVRFSSYDKQGRITRMRVPLPGSLSTSISPPTSRMYWRFHRAPMPMPAAFCTLEWFEKGGPDEFLRHAVASVTHFDCCLVVQALDGDPHLIARGRGIQGILNQMPENALQSPRRARGRPAVRRI